MHGLRLIIYSKRRTGPGPFLFVCLLLETTRNYKAAIHFLMSKCLKEMDERHLLPKF